MTAPDWHALYLHAETDRRRILREKRRHANKRGKVHGIRALERVLGSGRLRKMALAGLTEDDLRGEIRSRELVRGHHEHARALSRLGRIAAALRALVTP